MRRRTIGEQVFCNTVVGLRSAITGYMFKMIDYMPR